MYTLKHSRALGIVLTGMVMCGAPAALVLSCAGIFFEPVCTDLKLSKSSFVLYQTALYLTVTCFVPLASRLFARHDARICTSFAVLAMGGGLMLMSQASQLWHFIAIGILLGLGNTFVMFVSIPALIDRWFARHVGLFTGLCFAFTGIGGAIFSPLGSLLITHYGWRVGYLVFGIIALAAALPFTLCVVRSYPHEVGQNKAYAELDQVDEALQPISNSSSESACLSKEQAGQLLDGINRKRLNTTPQVNSSSLQCASMDACDIPPSNNGVRQDLCKNCLEDTKQSCHDQSKEMVSRAIRSWSFISVISFAALANGINVCSQYLPAFLDSIMPMQHGLLVGSVVISALSAGQALGKISLGHISDYSIKGGLLFGCLSGAGAFAVVCTAPHPFVSLVLSGLFYGFFYANGLVYLPLLTRKIFGSKLYAPIYARVSVVSTLVMAFGAPAWGALASHIGFAAVFGLGSALCILTLVVGWLALNRSPRDEHNWMPSSYSA